MRRDYAIYLLVVYLITFFGYNLLNVGHTLLHKISNPFHTHHHNNHYGLSHAVSDHSHALEQLQEAEHEAEKPESSVKIFFWFTFIQQPFSVSFGNYNPSVFYFAFASFLIPETYITPPTPPPNQV